MEILESSIKNLLDKITLREMDKDDSILSYLIKSETSIESWFNRELGCQIDNYLRKQGGLSEFSVYPRQKINNKKFDLIIYSKSSINLIVCSRISRSWNLPYEQIDDIVTDMDKLNELFTPAGCKKVMLVTQIYAIPNENNIKENNLGWMKRAIDQHDFSKDIDLFRRKIHDGLKTIRKTELKLIGSKEIKNDFFSKLCIDAYYSLV